MQNKMEITVRMGDKGLIAAISHEGATFTFPLPPTKVERTLENALLHIASGIHLARIIEHFQYHFTQPESSCPCCKLEGRVLSATGRKKPDSATLPSHTGTVQVRHLPAGLTGAQIIANDKRRALWTDKPSTTVVKTTKHHIEDLI